MYEISSTLRAAIDSGKPQRVLLEFEDLDVSNEEVLVEAGVEVSDIFCSETDLQIGGTPSSQISFELVNDEGQFEDFQFGQFKAWLGARIDSGTPTGKTKTYTEGGVERVYEFSPIGVFIADRPDIVKKSILAITAGDQMQKFDDDMPTGEAFGISYPTTVGAIFEKLCQKAGVTAASYSFLNDDLEVSEEPEKFDGATMRDVLGWIAEVACSIARFNRDGLLELAWFTTVNASSDEHDYKDFDPAWFEVDGITGVTVRDGYGGDDRDSGNRNNPYLIQGNPFLVD